MQEAVDTQEPVWHPLLDRVAQCSANPDQAIDFFAYLFWPDPEERLFHTVQVHPYMQEVFDNLEASALPNSPSSYGKGQQPESGRSGSKNKRSPSHPTWPCPPPPL